MKSLSWQSVVNRLVSLRARRQPRFIFISISIIMKPHRFSRRVLIPTSVVSVLMIVLLFFFVYSSVLVATSGKTPRLLEATDRVRIVKYGRSQRNHRFKSRYVLGENKDDAGMEGGQHRSPQNWGYGQLVSSIRVKPKCLKDLLLVTLITSSPKNTAQRQVIRNTWCSRTWRSEHTSGLSSQYVFLIGQTPDANTNKLILNESRKYGDILVGDFMDTYRNLTYKVITGFHWAVKECKPKFILKTDDDCFVNIHVLKHFLRKQTAVTSVYVGNVFREPKDLQVIRKSDNKWAVSRDDYAPDYYPQYASGTGYILSADVVEKILETSQHYNPFPNEDAYVGVLAESVHIVPTHSYRFTFVNTKWTLCNFLYLLVIHRVRPDQQVEYMQYANRVMNECNMQQFFNTWN